MLVLQCSLFWCDVLNWFRCCLMIFFGLDEDVFSDWKQRLRFIFVSFYFIHLSFFLFFFVAYFQLVFFFYVTVLLFSILFQHPSKTFLQLLILFMIFSPSVYVLFFFFPVLRPALCFKIKLSITWKSLQQQKSCWVTTPHKFLALKILLGTGTN